MIGDDDQEAVRLNPPVRAIVNSLYRLGDYIIKRGCFDTAFFFLNYNEVCFLKSLHHRVLILKSEWTI